MAHFGDPDGFTIGVPVVIDICSDAVHVVLVDVDRGDVPHAARV